MASESSVMAVIRASRPSFRNPHDKVAFVVHASFLAAGFSLVATGTSALSENPPIGEEEVGIDGWNELEDAYAFVYMKTDKGPKKTVLVKCLPIGDLLTIDVLDLSGAGKEPFNLQIKYVSILVDNIVLFFFSLKMLNLLVSLFIFSVKDYLSDVANQTSNYTAVYKNLKGLVDNLCSGFLAKLEPKAESSSSAKRCIKLFLLSSR
ncbi:hypothetical protein BHE74_00040913 [Ensete ventricosum]|nr:hypothetical protein GW17_00013964 [Ensete ventricosum]RWW52644.1 hypothetical protein BHE74_00040913 [Ensete ventricosum]